MVDMYARCESEYLLQVIAKASYIEVCIECEENLMSLMGTFFILHNETLTPLLNLSGSSLACDAKEQCAERSKLHWFNFYL